LRFRRYEAGLFLRKAIAMSISSEQYLLHEEFDLEDGRVARWRFDQLRSLGFGDEQAWLLAASDADLHHTRSLVGAGCPLHLALRILI
jgi:hypothetical protein